MIATHARAGIGLAPIVGAFARSACALALATSGSTVHAAEPPPAASSAPQDAFDPLAAWDEFEGLLRAKYAYLDRADIDAEAQFARSRLLAARAPDRASLRKLLHQTALTFADPHLIVGPFAPDDYSIVMTAADLDARFVGPRMIVSDVRRGSPASAAGLRPGDEIVSINGVVAARAARLPFGRVLPNPNARQLDYGATLAANGLRTGLRKLVVRSRNGKRRPVTLESVTAYARAKPKEPLVATALVGPQHEIAVLRPANSLGNNATIAAFDEAMKGAATAKTVVLDLRDTPSGGNTEVARSIIGHFTPEIRPYQVHRIPAVEREFSVPRQFAEYVHPRPPQFRGPVFVLHGRWTGSMGEGIVIGMDAAADAITVGSNMGDLLGALWNFDLPLSGARVDLGGEALFHVNGTPRESYVADHPLAHADTGVDGSDPAIAAVLKLLAVRQ